eukprot:scaffold14016_cov88-Skeletonema_marinoi.AAC.1
MLVLALALVRVLDPLSLLLLLILLDKSSNRLKMKNVKMSSLLTLFTMRSSNCSIRLVNNLPTHNKM